MMMNSNQQASGILALPAPARFPLGARQDAADGLESAYGAALDALGLGVVLVNDTLVVRYANLAARHRLAGVGQAAMGETGDLAIDLAPSQRWLLLGAVRRASKGQWSMLMIDQAGCTMAVGVAPLSLHRACQDAAAVLVLAGPSPLDGLARQLFCQGHRLTLAEGQVLAGLADGLTPAQVAAQGGVALCTVRSQITSIRAKTRATSIRHLLQLVCCMPPLMGAGLSAAT